MNETYDSPPVDRSIFARRVPGISNGELVDALQRGERPRDEPTVNDAFSRTSPEIYQHYQNANASAAAQQTPRLLVPPSATSAADDANSKLATSEATTTIVDALAALRRRMADVDASVREYHAKEMVRHSQVLETLDSVKCAAKLHVWILALIGAVIIGLVVLLLCLLGKSVAESGAVQRGVLPNRTQKRRNDSESSAANELF